jgi:hypothetical protein
MQWTLGSLERSTDHDQVRFDHVPRLAWLSALLMFIVFAALPISMLLLPKVALKLSVIAMLYLTVVTILWQLYVNRSLLEVGNTTFWQTAVECLLCPPLAINSYRKARARKLDFKPEALNEALRALLADGIRPRLQERLQMAAERSLEQSRLEALINALEHKS